MTQSKNSNNKSARSAHGEPANKPARSAPGEPAKPTQPALFGCSAEKKAPLVKAIEACFGIHQQAGFAQMRNTIADITSPVAYSTGTKMVNVAPHIGQLKLCLSEMELLTVADLYIRSYQAYVKSPTDENCIAALKDCATKYRLSAACKLLNIPEPLGDCELPSTVGVSIPTQPLPHRTSDKMYVIYAGAAPCEHMYQLALHLPPRVTLILVDPNQFNCIVVPAERIADRRSYRQYECDKIAHLVESSMVKSKYPYRGKNLGGVRNSDGGKSDLKENEWVSFITDSKNSEVRMFLIESFMDATAAKALSGLHKHGTVVYMSDIRTNRNEKRTQAPTQSKQPQSPAEEEVDDNPTNIDIVFNNCLEVVIRAHLKPSLIMLKFRQYFLDAGSLAAPSKALGDVEKSVMSVAAGLGVNIAGHYFSPSHAQLVPSGAIHLQCFAGKSSSETRLITGSSRYVLLNIEDYENRCYTYNIVYRLFSCIELKLSSEDFAKCIGYDRSNDCVRAISIFDAFRSAFDPTFPLVDLVNEASAFTKIPAQRSRQFGTLTSTITLPEYIDNLTRPIDREVYNCRSTEFSTFWRTMSARYTARVSQWIKVHKMIEIVFDNTVNTTTQTKSGHTSVYGRE